MIGVHASIAARRRTASVMGCLSILLAALCAGGSVRAGLVQTLCCVEAAVSTRAKRRSGVSARAAMILLPLRCWPCVVWLVLGWGGGAPAVLPGRATPAVSYVAGVQRQQLCVRLRGREKFVLRAVAELRSGCEPC